MKRQYSKQQLAHIREQASIYQCACPAQICVAISAIMALHEYQQQCINSDMHDKEIHDAIAKSAEQCYCALEDCLTSILEQEGWDMATLTMPEQHCKKLN